MKQADYQALAEFRHQIRCFLNFSEQAARDAGLEPQQHQMLLALKGWPAGQKPNIRGVAERLQVRHHSAVEMVDRLQQRGLVRRRRASDDRREVILQITPLGENVLRILSLHHRAVLRKAGPALVRALEALLAGAGEAELRRRVGRRAAKSLAAAAPQAGSEPEVRASSGSERIPQ